MMGDLSRFRKMIGGLGKRVYHWRESKESMNFLSFMYETILEEYAEVFKGDYEKAMDTLIDLVAPMSAEVVSKLLFEGKVLGVSFKTLITNKIEDLPYITETTLYAVFGSWSKNIFKKPILIPASRSPQGVDTIYIELTQCPFCCNTMIPPEKLGAHKYGKLLTLTIEKMIQAIQDYVGNEIKVVGRELKCFLNGDYKGEIYLWLYPRDNPELMKTNEYVRRIK